MILEAVFKIFFGIPLLILHFIPALKFELPENLIGELSNLIYGIAYIFPLKGLKGIFIISIALDVLKIFIALAVRIKSFIPGMGGA